MLTGFELPLSHSAFVEAKEVRKLPMAQICRGQVLDWPPQALAEIIPRM